MEIHFVLQFSVQILQHDKVDVGSQMTHGCVEKIQLILETELLEMRARRGVHLGSLSAVLHVDLIHILHQVYGFLLADILIERTAEIIRDIVFSVRECARTAEAAHNGAGFTADTALDLIPVDRTMSLFQRMSSLKHANLKLRPLLHQLICGKNTSRSRTDNHHIILHP